MSMETDRDTAVFTWFPRKDVEDLVAYVEYLYDCKGMAYTGWWAEGKERTVSIIREHFSNPSLVESRKGIDCVVHPGTKKIDLAPQEQRTMSYLQTRKTYQELMEQGGIPGWNNL